MTARIAASPTRATASRLDIIRYLVQIEVGRRASEHSRVAFEQQHPLDVDQGPGVCHFFCISSMNLRCCSSSGQVDRFGMSVSPQS